MPPLSEAVQIQLVIVFGSIITAIIGAAGIVLVAMLSRANSRQKQVLEHVQNSHKKPDGTPLNLRDDLDEKFEGLASMVKTVVADLGGMKADIRGIRTEASDDRRNANEAIAAERERIRHLEDTLTPAQIRKLQPTKQEKP